MEHPALKLQPGPAVFSSFPGSGHVQEGTGTSDMIKSLDKIWFIHTGTHSAYQGVAALTVRIATFAQVTTSIDRQRCGERNNNSQ
jgi:hypothetical protein